MLIKRSIYKTLFALITIVALSTIGFTSVARGYGADTQNKQVLGASTSTIYVFLGILALLILIGIFIFIFIRRRRKK